MAANSSFRRCSVTLISLRPLRGSKARSTLAIPLRSYSKSTRFGLPGLQPSDSRTSANRAGRVSPRSTLRVCSDRRALRRGPGSLPSATRTILGVVLGWDHPLLDQVRFEFVFLSVLRTVSCETFSTMPNSPALCPRAASKTSDCALVEVRSRPQGDQVRFATSLQRTLVDPIGLRAFQRALQSSLVEALARPLDCGSGGL
jgi:hypothetical protein